MKDLAFTDYLRACVSPGSVIALALGVALTVIGAISAAADPEGDNLWSIGLGLGTALVIAYLSLELSWKGGKDYLLHLVFRVYLVGAIVAVVNTLAAIIAIAGHPIQYVRNDFQYWLGGPWLIIPSLLGYFIGMIAGFAVLLVITLPVTSVLRSRVAIAANNLSENPAFAARNRRAMIALSVLLILVFLIPILIVTGDPVAVKVGVALIPLGVVLAIFVSVTQRQAKITEWLGVEDWQQTDRPVE